MHRTLSGSRGEILRLLPLLPKATSSLLGLVPSGSEHEALLKFFICSNENEVVVDVILRRIQRPLRRRRQPVLRVLDIGGGPGIKTAAVLASLDRRDAEVAVTSIDPDPVWNDLYRDVVGSVASVRSVDIANVRWEEFDIRERYDLVFVSHCVYGFSLSEFRNSLCKVRDSLHREGVACVVAQASGNSVFELQRQFSLRPISDQDVRDALAEGHVSFSEEATTTQRIPIPFPFDNQSPEPAAVEVMVSMALLGSCLGTRASRSEAIEALTVYCRRIAAAPLDVCASAGVGPNSSRCELELPIDDVVFWIPGSTEERGSWR